MARPNKKGLDYFPVDVDMFERDDVALITSEFGAKADSVLIRLLCRIYKNGYWCKWGDDECSLFCKLAGGIFVPNHVKEIVAGCVRRSIFDKSVFNMFGVLTSKEIQEKYLRATLERKEVEIVADYWLLDMPEGDKFSVFDVNGNCIKKINRPNNSINLSLIHISTCCDRNRNRGCFSSFLFKKCNIHQIDNDTPCNKPNKNIHDLTNWFINRIFYFIHSTNFLCCVG